MAGDLVGRLIDAGVEAVRDKTEELTELDRAIGDGDHGINMKRGFDAVAAIRDELAGLALPEALQKLGMTLVMKVGGASGPLYGSLFMAMGKALSAEPGDLRDAAAMLTEGVDAVKKRGKSGVGEKTMLDVLEPVEQVLTDACAAPPPASDILVSLRAAADEGLEATRDMLATKGRASFLGDRSIGHLDPGARSSQLLVHAVCGVLAAYLTQNPGDKGATST